MTNPIIKKAQRQVDIAAIERQQERLAALFRTGRISEREHDARKRELEARKKARQ